MTKLVLFSMLLGVIGLGAVTWRKRELPESVSACVYELPRGGQYLWTVWLWAVGGLLIPCLFEALPEPWEFMAFLWAVSVLFCGAMPLTEKDTRKWHYVMGLTSGVISQAIVWIVSPLWLLLWSLLFVLAGMLIVWYDEPHIQRMDALLAGKGVLILELIASLSVWCMLLFI